MKKLIPVIYFFFLVANQGLLGQFPAKYWVYFKDKPVEGFDPHDYFDQKAVDRRLKLGIPLADYTDLPVNENYLQQVSNHGNIKGVSRWMNAVAVNLSSQGLERVQEMSFVKKIEPAMLEGSFADKPYKLDINEDELDLLEEQLRLMEGNKFAARGIDGKGIRIAVFDGGFPNVDKSPVFKHLRDSGKIIATYDFVKDNENVYRYNSHGTMVLGCIAGRVDDKNIGLATGAEFLLARTETWTEFFSEEENWLEAMEWADKHGADIISSSLGYTFHRYFTTNMDGKTSLVVKAANMAASKGILVVNAMGNEGAKKWMILCTPADGDSVLAVGGIDPDNLYHIDFSSFGPTADARLKPNVAAMGKVFTSGKNKLEVAYGTSFATPLVTGFAACAWQTRPGMHAMEMFREIEQSGNLYPYYDYAHGYGIPRAGYFVDTMHGEPRDSCILVQDEADSLQIVVDEKVLKEIHPLENNLYFHIAKPDGVLAEYSVYYATGTRVARIPSGQLEGDMVLRVWFKGCYTEYSNSGGRK